MALDDKIQKALDMIKRTVDERKKTMGDVFLGFAFSRDDSSKLKLSFGRMHIMRKGNARTEEETYDYGNFLLMRKSVDITVALNMLDSILEKQVLNFDGFQPIATKVQLGETTYLPSQRQYWYVQDKWPLFYSYFRIDDSTRGNIPSDSLAKLGLPLFPNGFEAMDNLFGLRLRRNWGNIESRVELLVPDYRGRISSLRLAGNRVTLEAEIGEASEQDLRAKFFCKDEEKGYTSEDLSLQSGKASFLAGRAPLRVEAHIMSDLDGRSIDKKGLDLSSSFMEEGIILENVETQLGDIVAKGENLNVEFKEKLDNDEFIETVVSFANTAGGTIFLGVGDNCRVKGFHDDVRDRIENLISANCDPSLDVQIESNIMVQGLPITLVKVPEGSNKPYVLRDRGIFVRRGSSDRQIKRTELDDIRNSRQSGQGIMFR